MSTKTCLLCGRPVGRIRPGSGGDFCSREHRTQYGLRKSMDCLTEANKVASLARRRETPKTVFGLPAGAVAGPRGFMESPRITTPGGPVVELRLPLVAFRLQPAEEKALAEPIQPATPPKRSFEHKLGPVTSPLAPGITAPPLEARRQSMRTERTLRLPTTAVLGNAFRVSARAAFRPPHIITHIEREPQAAEVALQAQPVKPVSTRPVQQELVNRPCTVGLPLPAMALPIGPNPAPAFIPWPEAFTLPTSACAGGGSIHWATRKFPAAWPLLAPASSLQPKVNPFSSRRVARLSRLPLASQKAPQRGRLTFGEFGFSGATDAPQFNWAALSNGKAPVLEYKI